MNKAHHHLSRKAVNVYTGARRGCRVVPCLRIVLVDVQPGRLRLFVFVEAVGEEKNRNRKREERQIKCVNR